MADRQRLKNGLEQTSGWPPDNAKKAVQLALDLKKIVAIPGCGLRPGDPTALPGDRLRLLPSGPDRVHGSESRRTRPSTLHTGGCPVFHRPHTSDQPGITGVSGSEDPEPST